MPCRARTFFAVFVAALICAAASAARSSDQWAVPAWFVPQALCVHSGWHWSSHRPAPGARPEYGLAGRWWWRTTDIPNGQYGGAGEAAWNEVNGYGGGMQMLLSTWNRAADHSGGRLPRLSSNGAIARMPVVAQIFASYVIVVIVDHGSWHEWPLTSRACGLR